VGGEGGGGGNVTQQKTTLEASFSGTPQGRVQAFQPQPNLFHWRMLCTSRQGQNKKEDIYDPRSLAEIALPKCLEARY
jgi:hypothetical protein